MDTQGPLAELGPYRLKVYATIQAKTKKECLFQRVLLSDLRAGGWSVGEQRVEIVGGGETDGGVRLTGTWGAEEGVGVHTEAEIGMAEPVFEVVARGMGGEYLSG